MLLKNKRAQEEIVGFAIILIIVAIILLVFISATVKNKDRELESYEVSGFVQAFLQYTTECQSTREDLNVMGVIKSCSRKIDCLNGEYSCEVLENTLRDILEESWQVGEEYPQKGYKLEIIEEGNEEPLVEINEGDFDENENNYRSSIQDIPSTDVKLYMTVYY